MIKKWLMRYASKRLGELIRRSDGKVYLHRKFLIPRNRIFNVYLHEFFASDDKRAHHDHPWWSFSCILYGKYIEHKILAGGVHSARVYVAGNCKFRSAEYAHRLELIDGQRCITLFITGPKIREWGFHLRDGWMHWKTYIKQYGSKP